LGTTRSVVNVCANVRKMMTVLASAMVQADIREI
jgi:hypothetical protein